MRSARERERDEREPGDLPRSESWGGAPGKRTLTEKISVKATRATAQLDAILALLPELKVALQAREEVEQAGVEPEAPVPVAPLPTAEPYLLAHLSPAESAFERARDAVREGRAQVRAIE